MKKLLLIGDLLKFYREARYNQEGNCWNINSSVCNKCLHPSVRYIKYAYPILLEEEQHLWEDKSPPHLIAY